MNQQEIADNRGKLRGFLEGNGGLDRNPIYGLNWVLIQPTQEALDARSETSYYHIGNKICELCKVEFDYGQPRHKNCGEHKFYCICAACGNVFPRSAIEEIKESIIKLYPVTAYCSRGCANVTVHESIRRRREEDPEYEAQYLANMHEKNRLSVKARKELWESDQEWAAKMSKISAENIKHAHVALADLRNDPEWSAKMSKINAENLKHANVALANLRENNPEWAAKMSRIRAENLKYAHGALANLR